MSADPRDDAPPIMDTRRQRRYEPPPHYGARVVPVELHEISLAHFARKYLKLLWLHIIVAGVCFALAHYRLSEAPVKYRAIAKVIYQEDLSASGSSNTGSTGSPIDLLLSGGSGSSSKLAQMLAMMELRSFLLPLVERRNLLPLIFADIWDEASGTWKKTELGIPDAEAGYGRLADGIHSLIDPDTQIIDFGVGARTPESSLKLTHIVISAFNEAYRIERTAESKRTREFIQRELEQTANLDLRDLLLALYQQELRQQIMLTVQSDIPFKVVDPATAPGGPYAPNRRLLYMVAGAAALALSFFFTMVWPARWRRRSPPRPENATGR